MIILGLDPGLGKLLKVGVAILDTSTNVAKEKFVYVGTYEDEAERDYLLRLDKCLTELEVEKGPFQVLGLDSWGHRYGAGGQQLIVSKPLKQEMIRNHLAILALKRGWAYLPFPSGPAQKRYKPILESLALRFRNDHERDAACHALKAEEIHRAAMIEEGRTK